jgi:hypothetical protein
MRKIYTYLLLFIALQAGAQLPASQLFHFKLEEANGKYTIKKARWLTQFNPTGYNNQPYFINEDEIYITVQFPWDTTQTDIYSLHLKSQVFTQITNTPESEYSPKLIPATQEFSVVRVDANKEKTQRLWRYPLDRIGLGKEVFRYQRDIGYYHWLNNNKVALFIVDKPLNRLAITDVSSESALRFEFEPGRSFAVLSNGNIACVEKNENGDWFIKSINLSTYSSDSVVKTLPDSEDFVLTDNGTFLMGKGPYLYQFMPNKDNDWVQIANLREYGIKKIERLALNHSGDLIMVTK